MDQKEGLPGNEALRSKLEHEVGQNEQQLSDLIRLTTGVKRGGTDFLERALPGKGK